MLCSPTGYKVFPHHHGARSFAPLRTQIFPPVEPFLPLRGHPLRFWLFFRVSPFAVILLASYCRSSCFTIIVSRIQLLFRSGCPTDLGTDGCMLGEPSCKMMLLAQIVRNTYWTASTLFSL